ncbi:MAG: outer membrane protein transport protein, partial [Ignavibacteriae bacterium]|nr:outer membrane protein transport protein [Ignavibacteriota bacterium]
MSNLFSYGIEITALDKLGDQSIRTFNEDQYVSFRNDDLNISFGAYASILDNLSFGITYLPELNFGVDWPYTRLNLKENSSIVTAYDLKNNLVINSISPIISYKLEEISIGISANIYQTKIQYSFPKTNLMWKDDIGLPGYGLDYNFDGWSLGLTFGLLYNLDNDLSFALAVQTSSKTEIKGKLKSSFFNEVLNLDKSIDVNSVWENPWKISIGGLYKLSSKFALNIDISISLFSKSNEILSHKIDNEIIKNELSAPDTIVGLDGLGLNTKFKDSANLGIGLEYASSNSIIYRIGYLFNQSLQEQAMFSHLFPNLNQHWFSAGIGISQSKFMFDFTVAYAIGSSIKVEKNEAVFSGLYKSQLFVPSL